MDGVQLSPLVPLRGDSLPFVRYSLGSPGTHLIDGKAVRLLRRPRRHPVVLNWRIRRPNH